MSVRAPSDGAMDPGGLPAELAVGWTIHPLDGGALLAYSGARKLIWLNGTAGWTWLRLAGGDGTAACAEALGAALGLGRAEARDAVTGVTEAVAEALATPEATFEIALDPVTEPTRVPAAGTAHYTIGGRALRIDCADAADHARIAATLAHLAVPDAAAPHPADHRLSVPAGAGPLVLDGVEGVWRQGQLDLLPQLAHVLFAIWYRARADFIALHAGLVELQGHGLLLPGASGRGKTTAVAASLALGGIYHGDDVTALDALGGRAFAFPFPPNVKAGNVDRVARLFPELARAPEHRRTDGTRLRFLATPRAADTDTAVDCIVFPRFQAGAATEIVEIAPSAALERMAREWVVVGRPAPEALDRLVGWLAETPAVEFTYADPDAAVRGLRQLLERL